MIVAASLLSVRDTRHRFVRVTACIFGLFIAHRDSRILVMWRQFQLAPQERVVSLHFRLKPSIELHTRSTIAIIVTHPEYKLLLDCVGSSSMHCHAAQPRQNPQAVQRAKTCSWRTPNSSEHGGLGYHPPASGGLWDMFCCVWVTVCLETKATWFHVKATAAHKKRITNARTSVHLQDRCPEKDSSPSTRRKRALYEHFTTFQPAYTTD